MKPVLKFDIDFVDGQTRCVCLDPDGVWLCSEEGEAFRSFIRSVSYEFAEDTGWDFVVEKSDGLEVWLDLERKAGATEIGVWNETIFNKWVVYV